MEPKLTELQKQRATELFQKGYTVQDVYRHFGARTVASESSIDIEENAKQDATYNQNSKPFSNKVTDALGLGGATDVFGRAIARTELGSKLTGTDLEANKQFIDAPTKSQLAGASLQTLATAASPAIAPVGIGAQIATGAALGYAYDVGNDLIEQSTTGEVLTPGLATVAGAAAPPVLRGLGRLFTRGGGQEIAQLPGGTTSQATDAAALPAAQTVPSETSAVAGQAVSDVLESTKRFGRRIQETVADKADKAESLRTATPAMREAINSDLDEPVINFVTTADDLTKAKLQEMVKIADEPKKLGVNTRPTEVSEGVALDQYQRVVDAKRSVGEQIGKISDEFDSLKSIDVVPTQDNVLNILRQNGFGLDVDGKLVAVDNLKITDEQLTVINKLFDKITKQNTLSARNLHELDQWFSTTQRTSRMVDKIDDVYIKVPTPDGQAKDVNIFKVFRDAFGKRLDEVAPEDLRSLNRQYRQYANFLEDVEGKLVSNPEFSDLVGKTEKFAEAGLRRIFGEGKGASDREIIYNALDKVSRELGYAGPRADDLYAFGLELNKLYPDTVQKTSFRGQVGAGIMDKLGAVLDIGRVAPQDKQRALRVLLGMEQVPTGTKIPDLNIGLSIKPVTSVGRNTDILLAQAKGKTLDEPKKYKTTVNIKNKADLEYLERILSRDAIEDIKNGKMENWRGTPYEELAQANIISETPKTLAQKLEGRVSTYSLKERTIYHGTTADNTDTILSSGFKKGSELAEDAYRGGGYGAMQDSISFSTDKNISASFTGSSPKGVVFKTQLDPKAKVVQIKGITHAEDLNEFIPELKKQKVDAVYIPDEKEVVVINPKAIKKIDGYQEFDVYGRSQLEDIWKQANNQ